MKKSILFFMGELQKTAIIVLIISVVFIETIKFKFKLDQLGSRVAIMEGIYIAWVAHAMILTLFRSRAE